MMIFTQNPLAFIRERWRKFSRGRPGHRFQQRYDLNCKDRKKRHWTRFLKPIAGLALFVIGVILCFLPGPGVPFLIVGGAFVADVSRPVARALDWTELTIRNCINRGRRWWKRLPKTSRYAALVLGACLACGGAYGGFKIFIARM